VFEEPEIAAFPVRSNFRKKIAALST